MTINVSMVTMFRLSEPVIMEFRKWQWLATFVILNCKCMLKATLNEATPSSSIKASWINNAPMFDIVYGGVDMVIHNMVLGADAPIA